MKWREAAKGTRGDAGTEEGEGTSSGRKLWEPEVWPKDQEQSGLASG